ncbi:hypothetical protein [Glutamicibacter arilaitensis]|uniref:hypothetical protein n=1 Tax=Glutamicibacter arilaitensis TaxID=256701 RepID=UPI003FD332BE
MKAQHTPIKLTTLRIPRKIDTVSDVLRLWGVPDMYLTISDGLHAGICHSPRSWHNTVELGTLPEVYAKALKLASHKDAVVLLNALAQASIISQFTVQESLSLTMHLMNLDFRNGDEKYHDYLLESWEPIFGIFEAICHPQRLGERPVGSRSVVHTMLQRFDVMIS